LPHGTGFNVIGYQNVNFENVCGNTFTRRELCMDVMTRAYTSVCEDDNILLGYREVDKEYTCNDLVKC